MPSRAATIDDLEHVTNVITRAFAGDPVWGPALTPSDRSVIDLAPYWRLFVDGAARFGTARLATDGAAVSVWLPPTEPELSDKQLRLLEGFLARELDPAANDALRVLYERFDASRGARQRSTTI